VTVDILWYTRCPAPTAASVAIREGWLAAEFEPDGIAVRSLASSSDTRVHLSHYTHSQPNSFRFGGYVPPLVAASRGADLRIIGISWPDRAAAVLALPEAGLRSPADLRGRRFSVPRRLQDEVDWWRALVLAGYDNALRVAGLATTDVQFVDIKVQKPYVADASPGQGAGQSLWGARSQFAVQRDEITALLRGQVDVIFSDAAMGALVRAFLGLVPVVDLMATEESGDLQSGQPLILTVSGKLLEERPDLVDRWVMRLLDAEAWAQQHVERVTQIVAQDTGLPEDFVAGAYSARIHRQLDVSLSPLRIAMLKDKHDRLLRHGFLAAPLDFGSLLDPGPLHRARALHADRHRLAKAL
jgi:ABC-type nitrate/sulfonate/bicarbonate transport system substrate-binding protein